jgi:CheY-like chemotaxis protein
MKNNAPIFIVDDDEDEHSLIKDACDELGISNPVTFFSEAQKALSYLMESETTPLVIISDVNLSGMDGFELREKIIKNENVKYKSIPFIFWSGEASKKQIQKAYDLSSHGFFIKPSDF